MTKEEFIRKMDGLIEEYADSENEDYEEVHECYTVADSSSDFSYNVSYDIEK